MINLEIESKRLNFIPIKNNDFDFTKLYLSDPERTRYLPLERPYSKQEAKEWFNGKITHWEKHHFGTFLLWEKESNKRVGFCGLEFARNTHFIDIRYGLMQESWGKGYAFEAAARCIEYGFDNLRLEIIYGAAVPENYSSIHILKKVGMKPDSTIDCYGDVVDYFSITRTKYKAQK
ncbi:MAG: GNAT family N-acetyltransferase [Desulfobacteraceae bacterium]|nr:GNAT family N-acetyltransferase [Desulfobacteraceae bacterium]